MPTDPTAPPKPVEAPPDGGKRLVLVTGAGRSGTSTVAGTLHYLGLHVPLPVLKPNESNPRGFFESTWPLWFHRRLMDKAVIEQTDGRPEAVDLMREAVTPEIREELHTWLAEVADAAAEVVVKDPRSIWVPWLWAETAEKLGMRIGYLTMLRHPAEVMGSRATYYSGTRDNMGEWRFAVMNLCAWINGNLVVERQTRGEPRVVLRYYDLMADWRSCMSRVRDTFELSFNDDLDPGHRHEVDDFIDPSLRRHQPGWEGMDMPEELVGIAEEVYACMCRLADTGGADAEAEGRMDAVGARYESVVRTAQAIARDTTTTAARAARQKAEAAAQQQLEKARAATKQARQRVKELQATAVPPRDGVERAYRATRRRAGAGLRRLGLRD